MARGRHRLVATQNPLRSLARPRSLPLPYRSARTPRLPHNPHCSDPARRNPHPVHLCARRPRALQRLIGLPVQPGDARRGNRHCIYSRTNRSRRPYDTLRHPPAIRLLPLHSLISPTLVRSSAGLPCRLKLIARVPLNHLRSRQRLPPQLHPEPVQLRIPLEVPVLVIVVAEVVIVMRREVGMLLSSPCCIVSFIQVSRLHRKRRNPHPRKAEVIRPIVAPRLRPRIGNNLQSKTLRCSLHSWIEARPLRPVHIHLLRNPNRQNHVVVDVQRDLT